jgi:acyl-[acyl-carrier-protein]-phospholipid O-acyltransferase/long-chain-fatty-acid--[acyl-carrier-protein] ligase
MAGSKPLLWSRRFAPLFWCQFFSTFSDNLLRNALVYLILFKTGESALESLITLAAAVLIAPYFILSALGGEMADRYDKAIVAQRLKLAQIGVAILAVAGFAMHSVSIMFIALFGFGVIGSLFGSIKYGILPDLLQRSELPAAANALIEGGTFVAILLGTIVGGLAAKGGLPEPFAALMLVLVMLCWTAALVIPRVGSGAPDLKVSVNVIASTGRLLQRLRSDHRLWWAALVTSWFWLVGAVAVSLLTPLVKSVLGGTEEVVTAFLAVFSVGVTVGSGLAAWLAAGRIIILPTLFGAALLGIFSIDLGLTTFGAPPALVPASVKSAFSSRLGLRVIADFLGLAVAGGLYIVPTFAALQAWAGADQRARVVAGVNVLNAAFMVGGTIVVALLRQVAEPPQGHIINLDAEHIEQLRIVHGGVSHSDPRRFKSEVLMAAKN